MMIKNFFKNNPMHKKIVTYLDLFYLLLPLKYFLVWPVLCVGIYLGLFILDESPQFLTNFEYGVLSLFLGMTFIMSSYYIGIQLSESINKSSINFIKEKYSVDFVLQLKKYLLILGLVFLFFSSWLCFVLGFILSMVNNLWSEQYNGNFVMKLVYQLLIAFILSFSGLSYTLDLEEYSFFTKLMLYFKLISPYFLLYVSVFFVLNHNFFNNNKISKVLCLLSIVFILLGFILSIQFIDPLGSITLIVSFPFFIYSFARGLDKDFQRVYIYPLAILNFFCMTIFPYLFICSFIVFYLSKYYNWHRFDFHFPTFLVDND